MIACVHAFPPYFHMQKLIGYNLAISASEFNLQRDRANILVYKLICTVALYAFDYIRKRTAEVIINSYRNSNAIPPTWNSILPKSYASLCKDMHRTRFTELNLVQWNHPA